VLDCGHSAKNVYLSLSGGTWPHYTQPTSPSARPRALAVVRLPSPPRALVVVARPRRLPSSTQQRDWQRGPRETYLSSTSSAYTRKRGSLYRISKRTIGKGAVTITWCRDSDFLCRVPGGTRSWLWQVPSGTQQRLWRVLDKKYSVKKPLPMYSSLRLLCRASHSSKHSPSVLSTRQRSCVQ
jgi:hypothetical protein